MRLAIITLNKQSISLAKRISLEHPCDIYSVEKYHINGLIPLIGGLKENIKYLFENYEGIIFIMAIGIIVREISPYIKHKSLDPAILAVSVDGRFIIPILSGHLGGANDLAIDISKTISGIPVITTASDLLGKTAVDIIAKKHDFVISSFKDAMDITSKMINDEKIEIVSDINIDIEDVIKPNQIKQETQGLVYISYKTNLTLGVPFAQLIPKDLVLGIGAKKDTSYESIKKLLDRILKENNLDIRAISGIYSIDIKAREKGILLLAEKIKVPFKTYTPEVLESVVHNFDQSDFVKKITGVGAVSMPSGYLGSNKGKCIVQKVAENGITISIWENNK